MSRHIRMMTLSVVFAFGGARICSAQYGGAQHVRTQPIAADQVRAAVRTLLLQVDHLVEDMELDLVREPASERLLLTAQEVRDEAEHLAASVERGIDYSHAVQDFLEFDAEWHRLTRQASRYAADDRHLQRNLARVSQTDSELHRLLRVPAPVNVQEVHTITVGLQRASQHLREDLETDLRGVQHQQVLLAQAATLEEAAEHLEMSIVRGVDTRHMCQDFEAIDDAWLQLAGSLRELSPMRFDHVLRAAMTVATAEGQLRAALGIEPNPDQFTCFRPAPSDVRKTLPYAANGPAVVIPSGWRVAPGLAAAPHTPPRDGNYAPASNATDLSLVLGFLFGADPREPKLERPRAKRVEEDDDDPGHDEQRSQPAIKRATPASPPAPGPASVAPVPPKPIDPALQAKVDKNMAKLSAGDRVAALAQRTCPVSGELLGSRGALVKMKVKNVSGKRRDVFVCCENCEDELDDHPEKYRERLNGRE